MIFEDKEVEELDTNDVDQLAYLIVNKLCGKSSIKDTGKNVDKRFEKLDIEIANNLLEKFIKKVSTEELDHFLFNELLLLLDQHRVSKDFFDFLFEKEKIKLKDLKEGIIKFRGFAMLAYGNFRFAYKKLNQKSKEEIEESLSPFHKQKSSLIDEFKKRTNISTLEMEKVPKKKTWYNGYIMKKEVLEESKWIKNEIKDDKVDTSREDKAIYSEKLYKMGKEMVEVEEKLQKNTDIYLTWDYINVYVATSMRKMWEYEDVSEFIEELFGSKFDITELGLRYFDPTQSHCSNRIDKGLVEAFMLKRADCTIYMVQEGDTLGKISELASTLAQGKPVIAYVPEINVNEYTEKIKDYPLDFFEGRFYDLLSSGIFDEKDCQNDLKAVDESYEKKIFEIFLPKVRKHKKVQPYRYWTEKEDEFKKKFGRDFDKICRFLSIAEKYNFDKRANTLKNAHPLAIQVHLESGVANGVLVVRNVKDCAELLYKILTNSMEFEIKNIIDKNKKHSFYSLNEKISGCPFRVVTGYKKLTNSYWNLYLEKKF